MRASKWVHVLGLLLILTLPGLNTKAQIADTKLVPTRPDRVKKEDKTTDSESTKADSLSTNNPNQAPAKPEKREALNAPLSEAPTTESNLSESEDWLITFVKTGDTVNAGDMFFNVFRIENRSQEKKTFRLKFWLPDGARLIMQPMDQGIIELEPGKKKFTPVRVSFPMDVKGGIPFDIIATVVEPQTEKSIIQPVKTVATYKIVRNWRFWVKQNVVYAKPGKEYAPVNINASNKGNQDETIEVIYYPGAFLSLKGTSKRELKETFNLAPAQDTNLVVEVAIRQYDPSSTTGSGNKLRIEARRSTDSVTQKNYVIFEALENSYKRRMHEDESPLVISMQQADALGGGATNINARGNIFLPQGRRLRYQYGFVQNFFSPGNMNDPFETYLGKAAFSLTYLNGKGKSLTIGRMRGYNGISLKGFGAVLGSGGRDEKWQLGFIKAEGSGSMGLGGKFEKQIGENWQIQASNNALWDSKSRSLSFTPSFSSFNRLQFDEKSNLAISQSYNGDISRDSAGLKQFHTYDNNIAYNLNKENSAYTLKSTYSSKRKNGDLATFKLDAAASYRFIRSSLNLNYSYVEGGRELRAKDDKEKVLGTVRNKVHNLGNKYTFFLGGLPIHTSTNLSLSNGNSLVFDDWQKSRFRSVRYQGRIGTSFNFRKAKLQIRPSASFSENKSYRANATNITRNILTKMGVSYRLWQFELAYVRNVSKTEEAEAATGDPVKQELALTGKYNDWNFGVKYSGKSETREDELGEKWVQNDREIETQATWRRDFAGNKLQLNTGANLKYKMDDRELTSKIQAKLKINTQVGWKFGVDLEIDPLKWLGIKDDKGGFGNLADIGFSAQKVFDMSQPTQKFLNLRVVFFKDANGNEVLDNDEEGIESVLMETVRAKNQEEQAEKEILNFKVPKIASDENGVAELKSIPKGQYIINTKELQASVEFTNLKGGSFEVYLSKNTVLYVPYSRSVRISGKVNITRDKFSRLTGISPARIRVQVIDGTGKEHYVLTNADGLYNISVPYTETYKVSMTNVLGAKFDLLNPENEINMEEGQYKYDLDFNFKEKGRSINFGN